MNVIERQNLLTLWNELAARKRLYTATGLDGEQILLCLIWVKLLAETLKSTDYTLDDNEAVIEALNGMTSSFDHLFVALDDVGNGAKLLRLHFVKSQRVQEEQRSKKVYGKSVKNMESSVFMSGVSKRSNNRLGLCALDSSPRKIISV